MPTVKQVLDAGLKIVEGDKRTMESYNGIAVISEGGAKLFNSEELCDCNKTLSCSITEFAWRKNTGSIPCDGDLWVECEGNNEIRFTEKAKDIKWHLTADKSSNGAYYAILLWRPSLKNWEETMNVDNIEVTKEEDEQFNSIDKSNLSEIPNGSEWKNAIKRTVFGVGYLDEGPYIAFNHGEPTKAYYTWANMLKRCYCESSLKARPTYAGCSVCSEWHSFQNFACWFYDNYIEGYHLDKDTLVDGNKVYSPDTCVFISHADNNIKARAKSYTFYHEDFGVVEVYNLNKFCNENGLNSGHMCSVNSGDRVSHKGWKKPESEADKQARERLEAINAMCWAVHDLTHSQASALHDAGYRKE